MTGSQITSFKEMKTDLTVSMDDVVSAFVSTYEDNLFKRKRELTVHIKELDDLLKKLNEHVLKTVTGDEFEGKITSFDLVSSVENTYICWENDEVRFTIKIQVNNDRRGAYYNKLEVVQTKPLPEDFIVRHKDYSFRIKELRAQLAEVLDSIKSIARKERQVRGKIALRKLEDSGYSSLMDDQELKLLVEL